MSKVKMLSVAITQNALLKTTSVVPQWEAQVLMAVWGEDANVVGESVADRKIPDANDEFARLAFKYGPKDDDTPFVARVYGNFGPGVRALDKEIEESSGVKLVKHAAAAHQAAAQAAAEQAAAERAAEQAAAVAAQGDASDKREDADKPDPFAGPAGLLPPGVSIADLAQKQENFADLTGEDEGRAKAV